ncbi:MAG: hypothetical protein ABSC25_17430 [Roseiarcus sp.]|jgi:hypothetical protein
MVDVLEGFIAAEKTLSATPEWFVQDSEWLGFSCPLDVDHVTISGYRICGKAMLCQADQHVILQMENHTPSGRGGAITRIEWRPMNYHNNKGLGPLEYRFREIRCSHLHPFDLNWTLDAKAVRRGHLPIALPINPDPENFREFLALVGREFRIRDIQRVGTPPGQPQLI